MLHTYHTYYVTWQYSPLPCECITEDTNATNACFLNATAGGSDSAAGVWTGYVMQMVQTDGVVAKADELDYYEPGLFNPGDTGNVVSLRAPVIYFPRSTSHTKHADKGKAVSSKGRGAGWSPRPL